MGNGLPVLRHDWRWPAERFALAGELESLFGGWDLTNLGQPAPYPTFYWIGMVLYVTRAFLTPWTSMALVVASGAFLAASSALRLVRGASLETYAAGACVALFAALNPWVYAKEVAGHVFLVLAYALLLALVAELAETRPRESVLVLLAAASVTLIEFYAIVVVPLVAWALRTNRPRVAFAAVVAGVPIAYGVIANLRSLSATPYNLAWQQNNSVALVRGIVLQGYASDYTAAFSAVSFALVGLALLALTGLGRFWRQPLLAAVVALGVTSLLIASGTKGPLAHPYAFVVTHFKASGLYRELYDLIAFVAIAYVALLARGIARSPALAFLGLACAALLLAPWVRVPPRSFAVAATQLPVVHFAPDDDARVALFPAFQPMSFRGVGSGTDPDLHPRSGEAVPLNGFLPTYPVDAALALAAAGDARDLGALGVTTEVARPYLRVDATALRYQTAFGASDNAGVRPARRISALPVLGVVAGAPQTVTVGNWPGEFGIVDVPSLRVPEPSARTYDANVAWIDGRLTTMRHPLWGNVWGGVATASRLPLPVSNDRAVLAAADGSIVDDANRVVVARTQTLAWHRLPSHTAALFCHGSCAVAAFGDPASAAPEHATPARVAGIRFHRYLPWLVTAEFDASAGDTLRFAERYDPSWRAFAGGRALRHDRLASALNAWAVDRTVAREPLVLVETTAALQFLLEIVAVGCVIGLALAAKLA